MDVISVPKGLRLAIGALFLSVPLALVELSMIVHAPWWRLPPKTVGIWCGLVATVCVILALGFLRGRRWAYWLTFVYAYLWSLLSAWVAIRMHYPSLGFFTAFLLLFFMLLLLWLRTELGRSFFDPQLRWYQGLPKPIPALKCELVSGGRNAEYKVSRLDTEGAFIYSDQPHTLEISQRVGMNFSFRDRQVSCEALPMRYLENKMGGGFRFLWTSADKQKELGDFIEALKGEGYVE